MIIEALIIVCLKADPEQCARINYEPSTREQCQRDIETTEKIVEDNGNIFFRIAHCRPVPRSFRGYGAVG